MGKQREIDMDDISNGIVGSANNIEQLAEMLTQKPSPKDIEWALKLIEKREQEKE